MVWNPADFGGIEQIVVRAEDVWTPDILLYNRLLKYRDYSVRVPFGVSISADLL